jgi:general secretion pathway protein E
MPTSPHNATPAAGEPDEQFLRLIPIEFARRHGVLGLAHENGHTPVLMASDQAPAVLDLLARYLGRPVRPIVVERPQVELAVNAAYGHQEVQVDGVLGQLDRDQVLDEVREWDGREDLLDSTGRAPLIKLVNMILFEAVKQQASDIHLQPYETRLVVRFRVDGVLANAFDLPKKLQDEVVSRIKVMARMDIAEKRLPQDGRATVQLGERLIDLRIASLPTSFGERVVIRLLDKSARLYQLNELGMDQALVAQFRRLICVEHGLVLVTGPTGSGKTTTLYAALLELNHLEKNVLTLEDPIEYQLEGISQTQVNTRKQMTFASGLRNVLRQDPDIIMVGEIRDHETATMAIQSALTGHLVFSTLHTNDAASAVTRLLDLGIEPYLVASSLVGVLAQRLVRKVCSQCGQATPLSAEEALSLQLGPSRLESAQPQRGKGCPRCMSTGYRGRVGVFECLSVDDALRQIIHDRRPVSAIKTHAIARGMKTLHDDGVTKVLAGLTTSDEVLRVTSRASVE